HLFLPHPVIGCRYLTRRPAGEEHRKPGCSQLDLLCCQSGPVAKPQRQRLGHGNPPEHISHRAARLLARARSPAFSSTLRIRTASGVTSMHSSSRQNSNACSIPISFGGTSRSNSSPVEERTLVSFFSLVMLTS